MSLQYSFNPPLSSLSTSYAQPRKIVFGAASSAATGEEAKKLGAHRTLVVTDPNLQKAGLVNRIQESLETSGLKVEIYDKIPFEPTTESVRSASTVAREIENLDLVVGVGGGSVLDTAKIMAAMVTNTGDPVDYLTPSEDRFRNRGVKTILIPTTAGTGSEASNYSVVIQKETMYKTWAASPNLFADIALIDPSLTMTCPPRVTAGCSLDVGGHNMEGLISLLSNPISDSLATEAVKLLFRHSRRAFNNPDNLEARSGMAMASMLGGMVIAFPWIGGPAILGHCLAEAFGPKYRVPHGVAVGLSLPYILHFNMPACFEKIAYYASFLGVDRKEDSVRETAEQVPLEILRLMRDLELPTTLKQVNFPKSDLTSFAEYIVNERQFVYDLPRYNPRKLTLENMNELLNEMYEGSLER